MELEASDRLFMASAVMDTEPDRVPTSSLKPNSSRLHTMPTTPLSLPTAPRSGWPPSRAPANRRSSNSVMFIPPEFKMVFYLW